jgi:hypothetical protein
MSDIPILIPGLPLFPSGTSLRLGQRLHAVTEAEFTYFPRRNVATYLMVYSDDRTGCVYAIPLTMN